MVSYGTKGIATGMDVKYGAIDVIVSNSAVPLTTDKILETQESVLNKLWEINVKDSILILKDVVPHLRKGASIVITSSIASYQPNPSIAVYGVTKTALLGLTKALAVEMALNTRVNCIALGLVPTRFADPITDNPALREAIEEKTSLNRLGTTEDMATAAAFLASDDASYITGESLMVARGMHSRL
ncbi:hypothetical protein Ancab_033419 [Ancistrocladus abbreviatus]